MKTKRVIYIICAAVFFALFFVYMHLVQTYDVQAIGPMGSEVGFATFNKSIADACPPNEIMYEMTQLIGYLSIFICATFGVIGAKQLFTEKSLKKVDPDLICLGILYILAIIAYVVFSKVVINYRPVLEDEVLESSFPSSHTVLGIVVFASLLIEIGRKIKDPVKALIEKVACLFMIALTVGGRFLSGWHWATDITGGVILSIALIFVFLSILPEKIDKKITNCTETVL